jgi:hypothetical protein
LETKQGPTDQFLARQAALRKFISENGCKAVLHQNVLDLLLPNGTTADKQLAFQSISDWVAPCKKDWQETLAEYGKITRQKSKEGVYFLSSDLVASLALSKQGQDFLWELIDKDFDSKPVLSDSERLLVLRELAFAKKVFEASRFSKLCKAEKLGKETQIDLLCGAIGNRFPKILVEYFSALRASALKKASAGDLGLANDLRVIGNFGGPIHEFLRELKEAFFKARPEKDAAGVEIERRFVIERRFASDSLVAGFYNETLKPWLSQADFVASDQNLELFNDALDALSMRCGNSDLPLPSIDFEMLKQRVNVLLGNEPTVAENVKVKIQNLSECLLDRDL